MKKDTIKIVAISGSIRANSTNTTLLEAISALMPASVNYEVCTTIDNLPHFNPDLDGEEPLASVKNFRTLLKEADAVIVCTPEYAHGMPGVLKNALDWIVSSGEFVDKPMAAISASPSFSGGEKALASLVTTLTVMSANMVEGGVLPVPFIRKKLNENGDIVDSDLVQSFRCLIETLLKVIN